LPLTRLQQLTLHEMGFEVMPAAELRQLSSTLTSLTSVDFSYVDTPQQIGAAARGWHTLPMRHLYLQTSDGSSLQDSTLRQLSLLTRLSSLTLVE
jgi:hypothetical protein